MTKQAISAWHVLSIYPFFTVIFAAGIMQFKQYALFCIALIIFYQILINFTYLSKYSSPTKSIAYSSQIYHLIDFAKATKAKFICLDVDICNQLLSFTQQTGKFQDPFYYLDPHTYIESFIKLAGNFKTPHEYLYVSHADTNSHFPDLKLSFFKYLKENKIKYMKIKEFKDEENVVFEIYRIGYSLEPK